MIKGKNLKQYELDKGFSHFIKKFGEPENCEPCNEKVITRYEDKLPQQLFQYWEELGWCSYAKGLTWMVNPKEYQDTLKEWLRGTLFEDRDDLSVVSRTAFGELSVWAKGKGKVLGIDPNLNVIYYYPEDDENSFSKEDENEKIRRFWGLKKVNNEDYKDKNENYLFQRALKKFGSLKKDEQYGYKFSPKLGGNELLDNMYIVKLDVYHSIASQLEKPELIIIDTR